ncbi:unnamed protein product [Prorocentrum cordatum]|uniref:Uncharacterized protein n=1 Tax=Prorocentrum cordatum TaxID=2364126 RepID=A0ABN9S2B6_9DINO|nr:unnamed protein product [Polarella glacialis]
MFAVPGIREISSSDYPGGEAWYPFMMWYPYVANFVSVVLVLIAFYDFFQVPEQICAAPDLSVPSSTVSEVLALYRSKSDGVSRPVWVACMIVLTSLICFALGPLRDSALAAGSTTYPRITDSSRNGA